MNYIKVNSPIDNKFIQNNQINAQNNSNSIDLQKNFLNLLITQIKNQDPTNPIKNTELTSQLAQINTASGIEKLNNTVSRFSHKIQRNQNIQLSSLIGHHVMIPSTQIIHTKNTKTRFGIDLIGYATSVQVKITDKNNKILHLEKLKNVTPGLYNFVWDGKDLDKKNVATEKYNISVIAKNNNQDVPVESLSSVQVNSVITSSEDPILDLGGAGNTLLSQIREILK